MIGGAIGIGIDQIWLICIMRISSLSNDYLCSCVRVTSSRVLVCMFTLHAHDAKYSVRFVSERVCEEITGSCIITCRFAFPKRYMLVFTCG